MGVAQPFHRVLIVDPGRRYFSRPVPREGSVVTETVATLAEAARRLRNAGFDAVLLRAEVARETTLLLRFKNAYPNVRVITVAPRDEGTQDLLLERCASVVRESEGLVGSLRRLREERERLTRTALALSDAPIERLVPLIIEGDETSAAHIRRAFDKLGLPFPHPVAKSPREAMDALMRPALPRPTLALLALPVPEEPAFEFLSWFREQPDFQALPVFILSSSLAPRTRTRAFELGASGYFSKPTFPGEHVELIKSVIVRWGTFLRGGPRPSPETEPSASVLEWLRASS